MRPPVIGYQSDVKPTSVESEKSEEISRNNFSSQNINNYPIMSGNKKILSKNNLITCPHPNCNLIFKTQKLKNLHHNNLDCECRDEKYELLKTLSKYIKFLKFLFRNSKEKEEIKNNEEFRNLIKIYNEFHTSFENKELLLSVIGDYEELVK